MLGPSGSNSRPKACTKVSETSSKSNRGSRPTRMATSELVFAYARAKSPAMSTALSTGCRMS